MAPVLAVIDDFIFVAKVRETARQAGAEVETQRAADFSLENLRNRNPALVVFDLNARSANAVDLIRQMKSDADLKEIPALAFLSHVQVDLQQAAQQAGADQVMARSQFTERLPELVQRYALTP